MSAVPRDCAAGGWEHQQEGVPPTPPPPQGPWRRFCGVKFQPGHPGITEDREEGPALLCGSGKLKKMHSASASQAGGVNRQAKPKNTVSH